jgi:hypothetical protein
MTMTNDMNPSMFVGTVNFKQKEFEQILYGCYKVYKSIIQRGTLFKNNENSISDGIMVYLADDSFKNTTFPLGNYHFEPETREGKGRTDIKILPINPYEGNDAYYLIECKRLNNKNVVGKTGMNAEYIKNGICRFITEFYSSYYNCNGMFGFVVDSMDIDTNISNINTMLNRDFINDKNKIVNAKVIQNLSKINIVENFEFTYLSKHKTKSNKEITLYHLMFDFSKNIR